MDVKEKPISSQGAGRGIESEQPKWTPGTVPNLAIPPLQKEDRIGEWAPLFRPSSRLRMLSVSGVFQP